MPRTAEFPAIGELETDLPDPGDPTYQTEALALSIHEIIKALSDAEFEFSQAVPSDFTTFGGDTQDALDDYIDRYEDILETGFTEVVASLPDVLPIVSAVLSGGGDAVLSILLQGVLDTLLRHKDSRTTEYEGDTSQVDFEEVVTAINEIRDKLDDEDTSITERLEEVRAQIDATLNTFTINLHDDLEGATFSVGPVGD